MGDARLGAHQIAIQVFFFLALVLDAVAIAGQVIVGRMLGAGDAAGAPRGRRAMISLSVALGAVFSLFLIATVGLRCRAAFTSDAAVLHEARLAWPLLALMQPLCGAVFALDGILIGASDTSYLMWSMLASSLVFVPIALASLHYGWGIVGVWIGLDVLIATRLAFMWARFASRRWAVVGYA